MQESNSVNIASARVQEFLKPLGIKGEDKARESSMLGSIRKPVSE